MYRIGLLALAVLAACKDEPQPETRTPEQELADLLVEGYRLGAEQAELRGAIARWQRENSRRTGGLTRRGDTAREAMRPEPGPEPLRVFGPAATPEPEQDPAAALRALGVPLTDAQVDAFLKAHRRSVPRGRDAASYVRDYVAHVLQPRARLAEIDRVGEAAFARIDELARGSFGCTFDEYMRGAEPDKDLFRWLRDVIRARHPDMAATFVRRFREIRRGSVEYAQEEIAEALSRIHATQVAFASWDLGGTWTRDVSGLYRLLVDGEPLQAIPAWIAAIDVAPAEGSDLAPMPKLEKKDHLFGVRIVPTASAEHVAVCAFPLGYGRGGRQTYLVDGTGAVRFKDTDGKPVERWTGDTTGWTEAKVRRGGFDAPVAAKAGDPAKNNAPVAARAGDPAKHNAPVAIQLRRLASEDPKTRRTAAYALAGAPLPPRAVEPFVAMLRSPEADDVRLAARALGGTVDDAVVQPLADALARPETRDAVIAALGRLGKHARPAAPALVAVVRENPRTAHAVLDALAHIGGEVPREALAAVEAQGDEDAVRLLVRHRAADALARLLKRPDSAVHAAYGLATLGPDARTALLVVETAMRAQHRHLRYAAAVARWRITGETEPSAAVLVQLLDEFRDGRRLQVASQLRAMGRGEDAVDKLIDGVDPLDPLPTVRALTRLGASSPRAIGFFETEAVHPSQREAAFRGLSGAGAAGAEALGRFVAKGNGHAARELGWMQEAGRAGVPALEAAMRDGSPGMRRVAAVARWRITKEPAPTLRVLLDLLATAEPDSAAMDAVAQLGPAAKGSADELVRLIDRGLPFDAVHSLLQRVDAGDDAMVALIRRGLATDLPVRERWSALHRATDLGPRAKTALDAVKAAMANRELRPAAMNAYWRISGDAAETVAMLRPLVRDGSAEAASLAAAVGPDARGLAPDLAAGAAKGGPVFLEALEAVEAEPALVAQVVGTMAVTAEDPGKLLQRLAALGPDGARALAKILETAPPRARAEAARTLAGMGPDATPARAAVEAAMRHENPEVRVQAAFARFRITGEAEPTLQVVEGAFDAPHAMSVLVRMGPAAKRLTGRLVRTATPGTVGAFLDAARPDANETVPELDARLRADARKLAALPPPLDVSEIVGQVYGGIEWKGTDPYLRDIARRAADHKRARAGLREALDRIRGQVAHEAEMLNRDLGELAPLLARYGATGAAALGRLANEDIAREAAVAALGGMGAEGRPGVAGIDAALRGGTKPARQAAAAARFQVTGEPGPTLGVLLALAEDRTYTKPGRFDPIDQRRTVFRDIAAMEAAAKPAVPRLLKLLATRPYPERGTPFLNNFVRSLTATLLAIGADEGEVARTLGGLLSNAPLRRSVSMTLAAMGRDAAAAADALDAALKEESEDIDIAFARWAVSGDPAPSIPALAKAAQKDSSYGERAITLLAKMGPDAAGAVPVLVSLLPGRHERAARTAIEAIRPPPAVLVSAFEEHVREHRRGSDTLCKELARLEEGIAALGRLVAGAKEVGSRAAAARALGKHGRAARPTASALEVGMRDDNAFVAAACALARWQVTGEAKPSVAALVLLLDHEQHWREAVYAVRTMGPAAREALPALRRLQEKVAGDRSYRDSVESAIRSIDR